MCLLLLEFCSQSAELYDIDENKMRGFANQSVSVLPEVVVYLRRDVGRGITELLPYARDTAMTESWYL